ncbi:MAG: class I SAM-dependent methyltransferase family protein [Patescibacteria group bacterium]|jgi:hypothetical protein
MNTANVGGGQQEYRPLHWAVDFIIQGIFLLEGLLYHLQFHLRKGQFPVSAPCTGPLFRHVFDLASKRMATVYTHRARVLALEQIYFPDHQRDNETWWGRIVGDWFINVRNSVAVRNRALLVQEAVVSEILRLRDASGRSEFVAVSIACGSAVAMIRSAQELVGLGIVLRLVLYDLDPIALDYARAKAIGLGFPAEHLVTINANAQDLERELASRGITPDVCEVVGLLDYFSDSALVRLLQRVRAVLPVGHSLVAANVRPNVEMAFVTFVLDWVMKYRTSTQFSRLVRQAGFVYFWTAVERAGVYTIIVARR